MKTPSYIRLPLAPTQVTGDRDTSQHDVSHTLALKKAVDRDKKSVMGLLPYKAGVLTIPNQKRCSLAGIRTRVSRVRAAYPNRLDYEG